MALDGDLFMDHEVAFTDERSTQFIYADMFQNLTFPCEYPAFIQIHREHPAQSVPMHWHPDSELIYSRNKEINVTIDSKKTKIYPGGFVLISSYALHSINPIPSEERQDVMSVSFQASYLEQIMPGMRDVLISRDAPQATPAAKERLRHLCEQLRIQLEEPDNNSLRYFQTNQLLFAILQLVYSDFMIGKQEKNSKQRNIRNKLVHVIAYMEEHYQEELTTQSISDHFGYTREYFCRLFKKYSNQTFKQYLVELRLKGAADMLRSTDKKAGQIAIEQGFPDEKSFFTAFKKKYNMTPAQYRTKFK